MGTFIPNTKEEQLKMLNEIGYKDFDDLFKVIPDAAKVKGELNLPDGLSEIEVARKVEGLAAKNVIFRSYLPFDLPRSRRVQPLCTSCRRRYRQQRGICYGVYTISG